MYGNPELGAAKFPEPKEPPGNTPKLVIPEPAPKGNGSGAEIEAIPGI